MKHSHTYHLRTVYGYFDATVVHRVVVTETVGSAKPKIFTVWLFIEKGC